MTAGGHDTTESVGEYFPAEASLSEPEPPSLPPPLPFPPLSAIAGAATARATTATMSVIGAPFCRHSFLDGPRAIAHVGVASESERLPQPVITQVGAPAVGSFPDGGHDGGCASSYGRWLESTPDEPQSGLRALHSCPRGLPTSSADGEYHTVRAPTFPRIQSGWDLNVAVCCPWTRRSDHL